MERRTVLGVLGSAIGGTTLLTVGSRPSVAASGTFTASDVSVETGDGEITDVTLTPTVDYSWSNFATPPTTLDLRLVTDHDDDGIGEIVSERSVPLGTTDTSGASTFEYSEPQSLVENGPWNDSQFSAENGETTMTEIPVVLHISVSSEDATAQTSMSTTFTVEVTNTEESVEVSATANTNVET